MSQRVLLTGANGFVGSHILSLLLSSTKPYFTVTAAVRSAAKASQIHSDFSYPASKLQTHIVPDITVPGAFDSAIQTKDPETGKGFDLVIHTASPFLYKAVKANIEFMDPALKGTLEVLKSVKKFGEGVKRVVITSSCAAVVDWTVDPFKSPKKIYTEEDWNPVTWEEALTGPFNTGYQASKKFAESAAWEFLEKEEPGFDLVTLTPPMVYGPLKHTVSGVEGLNESNARIYRLFVNNKADADIPPSGTKGKNELEEMLKLNEYLRNNMHVYTDVRDLAQAHILAAITPSASNQRFIICAGQVYSQEISDILRKDIPELSERTPKGIPGGNKLDENAYDCSSEKAKSVLGLTFRSKEETFADLGRQLVEIEKKQTA